MAVRLESHIRRYLGLSTDAKPWVGQIVSDGSTIDTLPPGSSFLETDTGRIFRWDGSAWTYASPTDATAESAAETANIVAWRLGRIDEKLGLLLQVLSDGAYTPDEVGEPT